jgi:hypothetical protein
VTSSPDRSNGAEVVAVRCRFSIARLGHGNGEVVEPIAALARQR